MSYQEHVLKSTNAGTIVSQAHAALYNYPISKHKGSQVSFLNHVSAHFKTMVEFGHVMDPKTKISTVQYLLISQPNLHNTLEELEKLNLKSGITADIDWAEYLDGIYANATTHDLRNDTTSKPAPTPSRQVYSVETFLDASSEYAVDDDNDGDDDDYEQEFSPPVENGVTVMKARF